MSVKNIQMKKSKQLLNRENVINRITLPSNKRAVRKVLNQPLRDKKNKIIKNKDGTNKKTSNRFKVYVNPKTNDLISGTSKQIAEKLGFTVSQINYSAKNEKVLKDYIPLGFSKSAGRTNFINNVWEKDEIKKIPINNEVDEDTGWLNKFEKKGQSKKVNKSFSKDNKKFGVSQDTYSFGLLDAEYALDDVDELILAMWSQVKKERKLSPNDMIRVVINDPTLKNGHRNYSLRKVKDFNPLEVINFDEIVESNEEFKLSEDTTIDFITIDTSAGSWKCGGKNQSGALSLKQNQFKKKSLIEIKNKDNMCLARCIVLGMRRNQYGNQDKTAIKLMKTKLQGVEAKKLCIECGVDFENMCGIDEIKQFEDKLDIGINVIDGDYMNEIIYPDVKDEDYIVRPVERQIYIYKNNKHFDLINSKEVAGFFGKHKFCYDCKKCYTFKNIDNHKLNCGVNGACKMCGHTGCGSLFLHKDEKVWTQCNDCFRSFPSIHCYDNHKIALKEGKLSTCDTIWKCFECSPPKSYVEAKFPRATHKCGEDWCKNCKMVVECGHQCFMRPKQYNKPNENLIFYDFESDISQKNHIVNLSISQYAERDENIEHHSIDEFMKWAIADIHKGCTFIAHNAKGYDCKFVMNWIICNTSLLPETIYAGSKIMVLKLKKFQITFIDSLNFLSMRLKDMPYVFGLNELAKGYFPHWFNTEKNQDYIGVIPPMNDFGYKNFSVKDKADFINWYAIEKFKTNSKKNWCFKDEIRKYCISDVDILKRCCLAFRQLYLDVAGIDPFTYITIAGVCMAIYRYKYLLPEYEDMLLEFNGVSKEEKEIFNKKIVDEVRKQGLIGIIDACELEPMREGFYGGRTNACKILYTFNDDEYGCYNDITSLYPTVNFYDEYPKGHFISYDKYDFKLLPHMKQDLLDRLRRKELFGIIKCKVKPPKDLYHAVLPRKGEKLIFDLNDQTGTWATPEINLAIDEGYIIEEIVRCWLWFEEDKPIGLDDDDKKYLKNKSTYGLFKGYVSDFLKIKQESSDYPEWCETEEDKDKYIADYYTIMGIKLDKAKIKKNDGLRAIAKLCLNSLWGKFGQRTNLTKTEYISTKAQFIKIYSNPKYEVSDWTCFDNERMEIKYKIKDEYQVNDFTTSLPIAIFTTSHARVRLYAGLKLLGHQVLYFDTDSIIYVYNPNNPNHKKLDISDELGGWTDELEGKRGRGSYVMVKTFVGPGPKNYSYMKQLLAEWLKKNDESLVSITKIKGHTLNSTAVKTLHHQALIKMVQNRNEIGNYLQVNYQSLKRNKDHTISNIDIVKKYNFCYDKRQICYEDESGNIDTVPYGYENEDFIDVNYKNIQEEIKEIVKEEEKLIKELKDKVNINK